MTSWVSHFVLGIVSFGSEIKIELGKSHRGAFPAA
jgi:hypothetical protein